MGKKIEKLQKKIVLSCVILSLFLCVTGCSVTDLEGKKKAGIGFYGPGKGRYTGRIEDND